MAMYPKDPPTQHGYDRQPNWPSGNAIEGGNTCPCADLMDIEDLCYAGKLPVTVEQACCC